MGLQQSIKFEYQYEAELINFLLSFSDSFHVTRNSEFFLIEPNVGDAFEFEAIIQPYGLLTKRSGNYFEFLGIFVEKATGNFERIEIEDK